MYRFGQNIELRSIKMIEMIKNYGLLLFVKIIFQYILTQNTCIHLKQKEKKLTEKLFFFAKKGLCDCSKSKINFSIFSIFCILRTLPWYWTVPPEEAGGEWIL